MGGLLLDVVGRFWRDHVLARVPPPIDGSAAYTDYLRRRHPKDAAPALPVTPELRDLVAKVREAKAALAVADEAETLATNQLRAALGDAAGVEGLCSYRSNKDTRKTDWEGVAMDLAGRLCSADSMFSMEDVETIAATLTVTKPGARVLRLSKKEK
jgi:hypothetical protein